jgi:hypothetical protein
MSCIRGMTKRKHFIDWAAVNAGREADKGITAAARDAWLADKQTAFARIVPARRPAYSERGGL